VFSARFFHLNDFHMLILLEEWVELQVLYNYAGRRPAPEQRAISSSVRHVDSTGALKVFK
jgi:hypothetical protein